MTTQRLNDRLFGRHIQSRASIPYDPGDDTLSRAALVGISGLRRPRSRYWRNFESVAITDGDRPHVVVISESLRSDPDMLD